MWSRDLSLLMFLHQDDGFMVMTDTLATSPDGEPMAFTDKCWVLPSMNLIVATTGIKDLGARWVDVLYNRMLARDIAMLDLYAPDGLRRIWSDLVDEYGDLDGGTSTVYHFGLEVGGGPIDVANHLPGLRFDAEVVDGAGAAVKVAVLVDEVAPDTAQPVRCVEVEHCDVAGKHPVVEDVDPASAKVLDAGCGDDQVHRGQHPAFVSERHRLAVWAGGEGVGHDHEAVVLVEEHQKAQVSAPHLGYVSVTLRRPTDNHAN